MREVSIEEMRTALFQMAPLKVSGVNGCGHSFFKNAGVWLGTLSVKLLEVFLIGV